MSTKPPYTGTYTAARNPNSTMKRVLYNAGYEASDIPVAIISAELPEGVESETPVRVGPLPNVRGVLIREAEKAGYAFVEVTPDGDSVVALFRVVPDDG